MKKLKNSPRILLRRWNKSDALFIQTLVNSEGWLQNIGQRNVTDIASAEEFIERLDGSFDEKGIGFWCIESTATQHAIGMCGFTKRDYLDHPDLGFALLPEFEGQGLAFESAVMAITKIDVELHLRIFQAITLPQNTRSSSLLKRLGFEFQTTILNNDEELDCYIYSK